MEFTEKQLRLLKHILTNVKREKQINDGTIHLADGTYYNDSENNELLTVIDKKIKTKNHV